MPWPVVNVSWNICMNIREFAGLLAQENSLPPQSYRAIKIHLVQRFSEQQQQNNKNYGSMQLIQLHFFIVSV